MGDMARLAREIFLDIPHHLTQRGNYRQQVFYTDADDVCYLEFLWQYAVQYGLEIWAYCLMPNHVHLIAVPLPGASFPPDDALTCWREFLYQDDPPGTLEIIRQCTTNGLPLGDAPFHAYLEELAGKILQRNPRGRPKKNT